MNPGKRHAFPKLATQAQVALLNEACLNLGKNSANLTPGGLAKIERYKRTIETTYRPHRVSYPKKVLLQQRDGFFAALLPLLFTVVAAFLTR